jgi:hypothetical protein
MCSRAASIVISNCTLFSDQYTAFGVVTIDCRLIYHILMEDKHHLVARCQGRAPKSEYWFSDTRYSGDKKSAGSP